MSPVPDEVTFELVSYDDHVVVQLIQELQQEYVGRYGTPDDTPTDPGDFSAPSGAFVVGWVEGEPFGCVGLRRHDDERVEVKRMYVRAPFRGRGLSRRLIEVSEHEARRLGYPAIILETGTAQPEAMALYESSGYRPIPGFGYYRDSPMNRCYAKRL